MQKSTSKQKRRKLDIIHPYAAEIDIGSRFHVVAVPPDLDDQPTRTFKSLRKNRLNSPVFPSFELIALCSGWISAVQRLRPADCSD
jgi:hypothetical protein